MSLICPTILAATLDEFNEQVAVLESFACRVQIDLGDGIFTTASIASSDIWWPHTFSPDIHLMHKDARSDLTGLVSKKPRMIIVHAESDNVEAAIGYIREHTILVGLALLPETDVAAVRHLLPLCDHVLIFAGKLGSFGGVADMSMLAKVDEIRSIAPAIEIGWDGGANIDNVVALVEGGIDVVNVGSAIQKANMPENAYRAMVRKAMALSSA